VERAPENASAHRVAAVGVADGVTKLAVEVWVADAKPSSGVVPSRPV